MNDPQSMAGEHAGAGGNVLQIEVAGMHCASCPMLVEDRLKELPQVQQVNIDYAAGRAVVRHSGELAITDLQKALGDSGYTVSLADGTGRPKETLLDHIETVAIFAAIVVAVVLLQRMLPLDLSVSDTVSLGLAFAIGLVASVSSCMAVTGGLLVAVAARYGAANAHLTGMERLRPHLHFNAGRLVSYALLGGVVGALGSALMLSPTATGALTLLASAIMIGLGLQMLGLFPSLGRLVPTLPQSLARRIQGLAGGDTNQKAFLLGGLTFFLPCGFTQALQLYVLAKGDFTTGALTMLAFAFGTLPALLSLSALSSFVKGALQARFLKFAGAAVIALGVMNIQSGLVLAGLGSAPASVAKREPPAGQVPQAAAVEPQRIGMKVVDLSYLPNQFTVQQGVPVEWRIDGREAAGCGRILIAPRLGIQKILSGTSTTVITFTPDRPGEYAFNCGMGMMTPGSRITVLPKDQG